MEEERARALLHEERQRLERLLASVDADHDRVAPADDVALGIRGRAIGLLARVLYSDLPHDPAANDN
jgi:hypothetical protein